MLRAGLDFFGFTPSREEELRSMFLRFDLMLSRANTATELGISYPFRAWMVLSLLRLPPKRWAEILKECGRRLPRNEAEYTAMKTNLLRDRSIEDNVQVLHRSQHGSAHAGLYFAEGGIQPLPLYLALANGGGDVDSFRDGFIGYGNHDQPANCAQPKTQNQTQMRNNYDVYFD